jgi:hypothetical protein
MSVKNKEKGKRIVLKMKILQTKQGSPSTYINLQGDIAVPNVLIQHLTSRELFAFLQSRGIVGDAAVIDPASLKRK